MAKYEQEFSPEVQQMLGNYVYRLIDPRNGETFYIGKGTGNRVFDHVSGELSLDDAEDVSTAKISRIQDIHDEHLEVMHVVHRHEIPDAAVFEVEAALIDAFSGLTNDQGGHGSGSRGPMSTQQIIDKYELPEVEMNPQHKLVLININRLQNKRDRTAIYRQVRYQWRISKDRASKAEYVLAVVRGVVVGAFEVDEWLPATKENFPDIPYDPIPTRFGFVGREASKDIWERYVGERGKRIVNETMKHIQNPIRYWPN